MSNSKKSHASLAISQLEICLNSVIQSLRVRPHVFMSVLPHCVSCQFILVCCKVGQCRGLMTIFSKQLDTFSQQLQECPHWSFPARIVIPIIDGVLTTEAPSFGSSDSMQTLRTYSYGCVCFSNLCSDTYLNPKSMLFAPRRGIVGQLQYNT